MSRFKGVLIAALAALLLVSNLMAPEMALAQGSAALSIAPKKNYTIEAGKSVNDTLTIRNQDRTQPLSLSLRVIDFSYTDDSGAPKLMLDEDAPQQLWSLKPYLKIPQSVTIEPGATQTIDMSVSIPEGHGAGSYYSAIVYSSGGSDGRGNVGLSASGVTLVFADIPGQVKESLRLDKLGAYRKAAQGSGGEYAYFFSQKPQSIAYTLENKGNVTARPDGSITLKPLFGKEISIQDINPNESLALIGQTRTFTSCIKLKGQDVDFNGTRAQASTCVEPDLWPGYYRIELAAYYGRNGNVVQDIVGRAGFWYLPWWFVLVSVIVLAFVGYHVWRIVRYIKSKSNRNQFKKRSTRRK